jgi:hypothetical protein
MKILVQKRRGYFPLSLKLGWAIYFAKLIFTPLWQFEHTFVRFFSLIEDLGSPLGRIL